ncbi:hypothetical protein H8356DRAFT_577214 [Neocallimastix lanati (nom. inval.)]|uniref:Uncharacterized protein n=1 Tax=Neocallimastix californiae TaxID=1754190 RepID=A0A1Y2B0R5_9FUNG|nr:hypothetical protein H8356DRAFT_577214 [Neocallimastix sp. JGI-2020a]ORY28334.1 hypothetical protein LY90DRAFT_513130 [Neocallimastix californiae]|eukprot:ORY28334.1 hypothetical protein LY90DRAFT_513130 [Neocallimastix californiae]
MNDTKGMDKTYLRESYEPFLSSIFYEPAKNIAQLYKKKGSVGFRASDGTVVPLQTFEGEYYIDIPKISNYTFYDYDPFDINEIKNYLNEDFILNYTYMYDLKIIQEIIGKDNKYGVFSPGAIKILTTLGWELKDKSDSKGQGQGQGNQVSSYSIKYKLASEVNMFLTTIIMMN